MNSVSPRYRINPMPEGRLYVVGDIHGCREELTVLLDTLRKAEGLNQNDQVVFVGDYIDRGSDSRGVVDDLIALKSDFPNTVFLKGNHEEMLLSFIGLEGEGGEIYLENGGFQALSSYGISVEYNPFSEDPVPSVNSEELPAEHVEFYRNLERYVIYDRHVIVHAGLNPLRDLLFQRDEDIYWIRDDFISNIHFFDKTIIFGHTPFQDVAFDLPFKIAIDTGLVFGNMLSCLELREKRIFQVQRSRKKILTSSFADKGCVEPQYVE